MTRTLTAVAAMLLGTGSLLAQPKAPSVEVEMRPDEVYEGQSVLYQVTVRNVENPAPPELKGFDDFDVALRGEAPFDFRHITIDPDGQRVEVRRSGRQYQYQLTPRKTGLLRVPAPTVRVDGKLLKGRELTLRVKAAADQDVAVVQAVLDRSVVRPAQPFTVTLSVFIKEIPGRPEVNPVTVQGDAIPSLRIPWAIDDRLPKGVAPQVPWEQWLQPLIDRHGDGFAINDLRDQRGPFSFRSSRLGFQPRPKQVTRPGKNGTPTSYWQYDFVRTFTATRLGRHALGQVVLDGRFATKADRYEGLLGETIRAVSRPVEVTAEDAPLAGRPEGYIRAFGRFQAGADLVPKKARTGDPMTLTLTITGEGTFQDATAPDLARVPHVSERFKIYEATQEIKEGSCRFTYSLRPLEAGTEPFPAVSLAYYDPKAERYESIRTEPIPLEVTKAEQLSTEQIVAGSGGPASSRKELETRREGIFANVTDLAAVRNEAVRPVAWLAGLAGAAAAYVAMALLAVRVRRAANDPAALRRRAAARKARGRLREGLLQLRSGNTSEGASHVQDALVGLVADVADLAEAGLTPKDVCRELAAFGVDDDLVSQAGLLLDTCDAARYAAASQGLGRLGHQAEELLERLLLSLKAKKRLR